MGKRWYGRILGLGIAGASAIGAADPAFTGQDLYTLMLAQFATQAHVSEVAIPAWRQAIQEMPTPEILAAGTRAAARLGQLPRALDWAKRWHEQAPNDPEAARFEAGLLLTAGQNQAAIELLQATLARFPKDAQVTEQLAELLAQHGRLGDAQRLLQQFVLAHPDAAPAQLALGKIALLRQQPSQALTYFTQALRLQPDWEPAAIAQAETLHLEGQSVAALQAMQRFSAANPNALAARRYLAQLYLDLGGSTQAYRIYQQLSTQEPDRPETWLALGVLALDQKDWKESAEALERVRDLLPRAAEPIYYLGRLAEAQHQWQKALNWYAQVPAGPLQDEAKLRAIHVRYQAGQRAAALAELQDLAKKHPESPQIPLLQAQMLQGDGQGSAAATLLRKALVQFPQQAELWFASGALADAQGNFAEMERAMKNVIRLQPENAQAYNFLGYSLLNQGHDLDQAAHYLHEAIRLAPDDPAIQDSVGWLYYRQGQPQKALDYLRKAQAALGEDPEVLSHLGRVLWSLGHHNEARKLWHQGLQAHPDATILQQDLLHP